MICSHLLFYIYSIIHLTDSKSIVNSKCECQNDELCINDKKLGLKCVSKSKRSIESMCLNGGFQPKPGLPCVCPKDYYGIQCEFLSNGNITNPGLCRIWSCRNNAICIQNPDFQGYRCACKQNYHGPKCEFYRIDSSYLDYKIWGFSILSLLPFFSLLTLFILCICCCRRRLEPQNTRCVSQANQNINRSRNLRPVNLNTGYNTENNTQINLPMLNLNEIKDNSSPPSYEEVMGLRKA